MSDLSEKALDTNRISKIHVQRKAKGIFTGILTFLLLMLLIINIYKVSMDKKVISFTSMFKFFAEFDSSFNVPDLNVLIEYFTIQKEWAVLDGLRIFINSLGTVLGVVAYGASSLYYTISFASKFLIYILG